MSPPWMPLYIADYLKDTAHLRALESGAYLHLIMAYWANGSLPQDDRQLATIAKVSDKEWKAIRPTMAKFFGVGWQHKRIDAELAKAKEKYDKRAEAGKKGGKAKANAKQKFSIASGNATANGYQPQPQSISEPNGSDAVASPTPESSLWNEGLPMLMALGVKEPQARSMIGKWLRDNGNDHRELLRVISSARDQCPFDPIPWITAALKPRKSNEKSVHAAVDRAQEYLGDLDRPAGAIRGGESQGSVRLLSQRRG